MYVTSVASAVNCSLQAMLNCNQQQLEAERLLCAAAVVLQCFVTDSQVKRHLFLEQSDSVHHQFHAHYDILCRTDARNHTVCHAPELCSEHPPSLHIGNAFIEAIKTDQRG
jgi:hypothetical protein